ncbi:ABC transporter substrate-binding protein [Rhabdothermincola salaria]|uniref:ABC transporter substrate-binding protein n=1 Tax=Rhabdothermincola salaria TaxID=2903142 RepID=UPI001E30362A|nr:ABC transporter substrate-binding protein [Rhabdothermincola salaria]
MTPRRSGRATVRWLAWVLAVVVFVGACTDGGTADPPVVPPPPVPTDEPVVPVEGGVLRVASGPLPLDWSPAAQVWDSSAAQVARGLYDRLVVYDANGSAVGQLVEALEPNDDFTTWTIRLRRGVLFHDGTPLDASAVAANLEAQRASVVGADLLAPVVSVSTPSSLTVEVAMSGPWSTFAETLATQVGYVASPATLVGGGALPVGTGPFRMPRADEATVATDAAQGGIVLVANDFYWQAGLPRLDAVAFPVLVDPMERVAAVIAGEADLVAADRPDQLVRLDRAARRDTVTVVEDRNAESPKVAIALNTAQAPFDRISARRAVGLATDRDEMVDDVLDGEGTLARSLISDPSPWFSDLPLPVPDGPRSRGEAATYAEEAGEPLAVELLVPPDPLLGDTARLWRRQLAEVDISVTLVPVTDAELADRLARGQYQAAITIGFVAAHPDLYEPEFRGLPGEQPLVNPNLTRYVNPVVTESFDEARATADVAAQVEAYRIVQEQLFNDVPWLFLVQLRQGVAFVPGVRDVTSWELPGGGRGLGQDGVTVALAQIWLDPTATTDTAERAGDAGRTDDPVDGAPTTPTTATSLTGGPG